MAVSFNSIGQGPVRIAKVMNRNSDYDVNQIYSLINAVEIDWNGAVLSDGNPSTGGATSAISSTADLLELINTMQKEIYVLTAAVIALAQK